MKHYTNAQYADLAERLKEDLKSDRKKAIGTFYCKYCKEHMIDCEQVGLDIYCHDCDSFILKLAELPIKAQSEFQLFFL